MSEDKTQNLLSVDEVAEALGCSKMHVHRLVQAGSLTPVNISVPGTSKTRFRFTTAELQAFYERSLYTPVK
jgi:excisionase family DNA binding protein